MKRRRLTTTKTHRKHAKLLRCAECGEMPRERVSPLNILRFQVRCPNNCWLNESVLRRLAVGDWNHRQRCVAVEGCR